MAREFSRAFYDSSAWRKCRKSFISYRQSVDGGMCQMCGEKLGYIVDHIKELSPQNINNPDITLNHNNLQYLCLDCHNKKTFMRKINPRYYFDSKGQIHPVPPINE